MIRRIFNLKNFVRAFSAAFLALFLYKIIDLIFKDETDWTSNTIKASIIFFVVILVGVENLTWREVFFGKRKNKN